MGSLGRTVTALVLLAMSACAIGLPDMTPAEVPMMASAEASAQMEERTGEP